MNHDVLHLLMTATLVTSPALGAGVHWSNLPSLPDAKGFAGMYAGVSDGALIAAGGANFPDRPLAQGGKKVWHDKIYVLERPDGAWREAGRLPHPAAYGVSATWRGAVVCAGGDGPTANFADAWLMRWDHHRLAIEALPSLPRPVSYACGLVLGDTFYVIGGQLQANASAALDTIFILDLAAPGESRQWRQLAWPVGAAPRILAIAGSTGGELYLFSGITLKATAEQTERKYLSDAYAFHPQRGWRKLADLPYPAPAGPSPATAAGAGLLLFSGDATIPGQQAATDGALPRELLEYDIKADRWTVLPPFAAGPNALPARVTAPIVSWNNLHCVISGEIAAGIRTPTVLTFELK